MAKNDDEEKKQQKRYAAETRGMPSNLARIAARNLAAEDARIGKLNEIRGRLEPDSPNRIAAIGERYKGTPGSIPEGAAPGTYATGVVGTQFVPPREAAFNRAAAYAKGFGEAAPFSAGGFRFAGGVAAPEPTLLEQILPFLGRFAARGGFSPLGFTATTALGAARSFFPAIRSFFNSGRPRPYNPAPPLQNVGNAAPSPTPSPSPSPSATPDNPYYAGF